MKNRDVVIIGGGVNGLSIAYNLMKSDPSLKVTLLEKGYISSGSTGKCGGGLRTQFTTRESCDIALKSIRIFENLNEELEEDIELRKCGYLILAHSEGELSEFRNNVKIQNSIGVPSRILGEEEIKNSLPAAGGTFVGAEFCGIDGVANPFKTSFAFRDRANSMGAEMITHCEAKNIEHRDERFFVKTKTEEFSSEFLVNAAGMNSGEIAASLGINLPVKPYKHEIFATEVVDHFLDPMVISFSENFYISQTMRGELVGGYSPPDLNSGGDLTPTFDFLLDALGRIAHYIPEIRSLKLLRHWAGNYDVTPDAMPILGEVENIKGFIQANGFSGHGFMLSPFVGRAIASLITGKDEFSDTLKNFSLGRFKDGIIRERAVVG